MDGNSAYSSTAKVDSIITDFDNKISDFNFYSTQIWQPGAQVDLVDFIDLICAYKGKTFVSINLQCVWSFADAITIVAGEYSFSSAGLQLIGGIGRKEMWRKYQFLLLTDNGQIYKAMIWFEGDYSPHLWITELS